MGESAYIPSAGLPARLGIHSRISILLSTGLLFAIFVFVQILGADASVNMYDEGIVLSGAERISNGGIPYRDFWTMYGPAQFYLTSWLFEALGPSVMVLRAIGIGSKALIALLIFTMASRHIARSAAILLALLSLGMLMAVKNDAFPVFPALALSLGAFIAFIEGRRLGWGVMLASGVLTGLAATFRHDLGAYNAVAVLLLALGSAWAMEVRLPAGAQRSRTRVFLVCAGVYLLGVGLVLIPVGLALWTLVPTVRLYEDLIQAPSKVYPQVRALPFPGVATLWDARGFHPTQLGAFIVYVPFAAAAWALLVEVRRIQRHRAVFPFPQYLRGSALQLALAAMTLLFALKGIVRVSALHMTQALVLSGLLLAVSVMRINWRQIRAWWGMAPALGLMLALMAPLAISGWMQVAVGLRDLSVAKDGLLARCLAPQSARLRCVSLDEDTWRAAEYVKAHTRPYERIYVGTTRHDKIFINSVALYFAAERGSATAWQELHPGIQTTLAVQRAMVAEFGVTPPKLVVLDERWDAFEEPNASAVSSHVTLLDTYLASHFKEVARFGSVHVLARRDG